MVRVLECLSKASVQDSMGSVRALRMASKPWETETIPQCGNSVADWMLRWLDVSKYRQSVIILTHSLFSSISQRQTSRTVDISTEPANRWE